MKTSPLESMSPAEASDFRAYHQLKRERRPSDVTPAMVAAAAKWRQLNLG